ncbi:hypothetical protein C5L30_002277 [Companilactobacillus farciminis]|uniref:Uncharacterized protein n=1 Tax=Companilactobacillus farciminis TaxID=1612 RepID=A0A4R5NDQ6_9LACO|nr:hypothetical protein [Companilactobacillus farciminis]ATO45788.1 hypothetical protein LF20184_03005 [Companilactobacillus farciminis KCTC 3681 = DSM 20184]TDG71697.1 hypothetical protein C5L30_002277 [Companilactobacillus farciminis]
MKRFDQEILLSTTRTDDDKVGQPFLIQNTFYDRHGEIKKRTLELDSRSDAYEYFYIQFSSDRYQPDQFRLILRLDNFKCGNIDYAEEVKEQIDEIVSLAEKINKKLKKEGWIEFK